MEKLILIDGNSLINRAYYATPPMSNSKGVQTNAVLGCVNMIIRLLTDEQPDYMLVAFDRKEPTFRHKMFADYKGTRRPMPDDLRPQIPLMKELLDSMGISHYEQAGSEADDIIGTLAKRFGVQTLIVTGDKDSFQLVDDTTSVMFTRRGISDTDLLTADNFKEKVGIMPPQIIDLKALMGDKSDNIPGVAGVGEKTALGLIDRYGSVENLYAHIDELSGKLRERVESCRDICNLSKQLATIDVNVDTGLTLGDMRVTYPFPQAARRMFVDLEFRSLIKKDIFAEAEQGGSGEDDIAEPEFITLADEAEIQKLFSRKLGVYIGDDIRLSDGTAEYRIPIRQSFFDEGFAFDSAIACLRPLFENAECNIIVFSIKKTEHMLDEFGIGLNAHAEDVSLEKYIADYTGKEETIEDVITFYNMPAGYPAYCLFKLNERLHAALEKNGQSSLYSDIEIPLARVLFDMERAGFRVDEGIIHELNAKYKEKIAELSEKIYELAGEKFNINSPKQLGAILFEKLKLGNGRKKQSTNAEVLEELSDRHEIVPLILQYRRVAKLNSTYIEGFLPLIDKRTGLIHTVFNQTLTSTGRLSSKEPNLQNLPIRDEEGKEIRRFFVPSDENHILVGADYSQIELRLLAHFSGCTELIEAYKNGDDIHSITASQVFGVPLFEVTKDMRRKAKAVNFGIIYGISDFGLAKNLKISPKVAKQYIEKYFESYPHVKEYMESNVAFARENGYVSTLCGRKRYIKDINSPNFNLRSFSERAAMNMPLQGSSADIIKIAMIRVSRRLKAENLRAKLILQVHDELIIDTPLEEEELVKSILKYEMENSAELRVPLEADVYSGRNLYEAK